MNSGGGIMMTRADYDALTVPYADARVAAAHAVDRGHTPAGIWLEQA
ncbi:MAG: hypothetical protein R2716_10875 [Microthrixaceae bacterium]